MLFKTAPIIRDMIQKAVPQAVSFRYDMCTCPICQDDIAREAITGVDAVKETIEAQSMEDAAKQFGNQYQGAVNHAILRAIDKVAEHPSHAQSEDRRTTFKLLLKKILLERGLDFRSYHSDLLKRRLALRIKANNLYSYTDYMKLLEGNDREYNKLFETLCINVSEFFRDPPLWVTLQYLLEKMITEKVANGDRTLSIWSAGCANGEEAYSLAIAAQEALKFHSRTVQARIVATDIDKAALAGAQKALYSQESIKNVNDKLLSKYFVPADKNTETPDRNTQYLVRESVASMVSFSSLDLIAGEFPEGIDLLLCRNVFIYFDRQLQEHILKKFFNAIRPGGYLCLGQSESMLAEVKKLFEDTDSNARIYRRP